MTPHRTLPADDPFASLFNRTFEGNYSPDIFQNKTHLDRLRPASSPISFYDRHVASHLTLKQIVYQPSLVSSISTACNRAIDKFLNDGHKFHNTPYPFFLAPQRELFRDAHTAVVLYRHFAAYVCSAYAYKLAIHPERETWESPLNFEEDLSGSGHRFTTEAWLEVTTDLKDRPELMDGLDETSEKKIQDLLRKYPRLATWHMFAMTDTAIWMFQTLTKNAPFNWEACRTLGYKTIPLPIYPPDARKGVVLGRAPKRSKARVGTSATVKASKAVTVPRLPLESKQYRPEFRHYIQHAWATAATNDSTFMIFQCGLYERIGFRHRASQTLYLSGLIDPINMKDPSYRKLHVGLHTAVVQDALDRLYLSNSEPKTTRKRSVDQVDEVEVSDSERPKDIPVDEVDNSEVYDEIARRDLMLVTLDYGAFCSPSPSSFLRIGPSCVPGHAVPKRYPKQTRFNVHEYVSLVLKEPLGEGAVGIVHPAAVTLTLKSGQVVKRDMVIKFAFSKEQEKKMFHEFRIYGDLSFKKGLEGIVTVHGVFRDPESGSVGMLMNEGGQSLRQREIERGGDGRQVTGSPEEREAFRRILKGLHEAGIRHHDIRSDNLLINSRNQVYIIDFDCADYEVNSENTEREMECLDDLLEGQYEHGSYYSY
ncbi:hypothetical protein CPB84DRAFT_1850447 [Gymnopilus junonius]|uniref:Protein kinase domain-containing protein n=1 Tax=Gymnopilus junonius TaxID=109634 RepID=A0A9P5NGJ9_GYMJU|nr:hypothetical protein CPB84DRAFT_1850447 [Gymnopilus junonius]